MSQFLSRIETLLLSATDPAVIAELKARKSCYLSRTGYFEESRFLIGDLRKDFGAGENAKISTWIMLAEGVAEFFQHVGPTAKDRIARAQLIALAIRDRELGAITSAWKAQADFETSDFDSMAKSLATAMELTDPSNHEAGARIALTLSNCMYLYGDRASAQRWFIHGRQHALDAGDQATIDALLHNRAAFGMAYLRAERCFDCLDQDLVNLVHLEILSAENFQSLARIVSLNHLIVLCKARTLLLKEHFEEALHYFASVRTARPFAKYNFSDGIVDLEMAYCLQRLGRDAEALQLFRSINELDSPDFDIDDKLVTIWIQFELAKSNREFGDFISLKNKLLELMEIYQKHNERLKSIIARLSSPTMS